MPKSPCHVTDEFVSRFVSKVMDALSRDLNKNKNKNNKEQVEAPYLEALDPALVAG
jgi:hypothetical protein